MTEAQFKKYDALKYCANNTRFLKNALTSVINTRDTKYTKEAGLAQETIDFNNELKELIEKKVNEFLYIIKKKQESL